MPNVQEVIRVLIIDDDPDDFAIISDYMRTIESLPLQPDWCNTYQHAVEQLAKRQHDLYFIDYRLGAKTGLDLLRDAMDMRCEEPIILLTGNGNPAVDNEAMRIGAMDYLIKSELTPEKLERCSRYALERSATLKALRASERKYRNIYERSKDAIFITDLQLRFRDMNSATSQLLEYADEDLRGMSLYQLIDDEACNTRIATALQDRGEVIDLEIVLVDRNREKKYFVLTAAVQYQNNGTEDYVQGILHDITNLKKAERVTLHAEKLAAGGRLVRTLAHEVRNPLNNIQMAVEQLGDMPLKPDDQIFIDIIQRNCKRIDKLIAELLDSYRPTEKSFRVVNLRELVEESIQQVDDRLRMKRITVCVDYPEQTCTVLADGDKLRIALLNILVNAAEAIADHNGRIDVSLRTKGVHHWVEIKDSGCGIPTEILGKLFEPYFTSKRNGMGLGLAATLNIVQAHGGMIDVKSQVGEGTTFLVTLPATSSNDSETVTEQQVERDTAPRRGD